MAERNLIEPDLEFIDRVAKLGGADVKKCFQCATCSVACTISPDNKPFPRKEMIATSWGLKDKVVKNADIWLCHQCGDCSTRCPRGAKPGDVLSAVRAVAVEEYATPKFVAKLVNDPKKLPVLIGIPVVLFLVLGLALKIFGINWLNFSPALKEGAIAHANFFSTWLVDIIMIPTFFGAMAVFALGLKRFVFDIHENAVLEGKTNQKELNFVELGKAFVKILPDILKHKKFAQCGENEERSVSHLMVFYGFAGLFIVTNIFFVVLYVFQIHGPYSQLNPVKWLGNLSGIILVLGSALMIKDRLMKSDQATTYKDWYLLGLVFGLGLTGMLTQMTRLGGSAGLSYFIYFVHLVFVFNLFAFLPFSKLAHVAYRTVALAYLEYSGRK